MRTIKQFFFRSLFLGAFASVSVQAQNLIIQNAAGDTVAEGEDIGASVSEKGTTQVFTVTTDSTLSGGATTDQVMFHVSIDDDTEVKILSTDNSSEISYGTDQFFTMDENQQSYSFRVQGVDDSDEDGAKEVTITVQVDDGDGPVADGPHTFTVTNNDDDGGIAGNVAPSEPTQRFPLNGGELKTNDSFLFEHAYDADKDTLTYQVCVRADSDSAEPYCTQVGESAIVEGSGVAMIGWPVILAVFLSSLLYFFAARRRRPRATHIVQFAPQVKKRKSISGVWMVAFLLFLGACGNQALLEALNVSQRPSVKVDVSSFSNISAGSDYRWRVYADDGNGNITATSAEFTFSARNP